MFEKRFIVIALILCIAFQTISVNATSLDYFDERIEFGKIVEVIDGEVVKASFQSNSNDEPILRTVKMIGIDTEASTEAFNYVSTRLQGQTVYFIFDKSDDYKPDYLEHADIYYDLEKTVAEELVDLGYAKVDENYRYAEQYQSLVKAQAVAKLYEVGMWETNLSKTTDRININKANSTQLMDVLDIDLALANKVYNYRSKNKFNDITEIMAVDDYFDGKWFDEHKHLLSVITNVNKASYLELTSLIGTSSDVQKVIDEVHYYTRFNEIKRLSELKSLTYFHGYYDNAVKFMTLDDTNIYEEVTEEAVNINTTNSTNFQTATGLKDIDFKDLEAIRKDGYIISTLGELGIKNKVFSQSLAYRYSDHLKPFTNLNTASEMEIASLFDQTTMYPSEKRTLAKKIIENRPYAYVGKLDGLMTSTQYKAIKPFVYVYEDSLFERYNINTIDEKKKSEFDEKYDGHYTRYTNINTASIKMLKDLHPDIYYKVLDDIIEYRNKYDFRFKKDLEAIFAKYNQRNIYDKIEDYIVFE